MKQQSEHLSNAQIEQYGKRASGAGPETEAWVEQHLDDCSSCRSRVLDFHRTRFALLPDPKVNKASTSDCPSEDDLRNLAAGLCPDAQSAQLKAHAATCGHCGPLLQEYIEDFSDETSPEEQAALAQLRSASPEWHQQKAREMLKQVLTPVPLPSPRWTFTWRWALIPAAAAACAAIAVSIWYTQRDTPEKVEKLLAQAATEQRTIEMRWPGAAWGPVRVRQAPTSTLQTSVSLLEAENMLERQHADSSSNQPWLQMSSRADMLNWRPQAAIDKLTQLFNSSPSSTALELDLAIAYFQLGEITGNISDYKQSLKYLNDILHREPLNHAALYNRAVVIERLGPISEAIRTWSEYLELENEPHWASEARNHLSRLKLQK